MKDSSLELALERYKEHLMASLLCICSLGKSDGIKSKLTSWLGSLVVIPEYQNLGVGKMLIAAIKKKAKMLGFTQLFLFAFSAAQTADYYRKLGWTDIGTSVFKEQSVIVMHNKC